MASCLLHLLRLQVLNIHGRGLHLLIYYDAGESLWGRAHVAKASFLETDSHSVQDAIGVRMANSAIGG